MWLGKYVFEGDEFAPSNLAFVQLVEFFAPTGPRKGSFVDLLRYDII
jgi:hypothetical protein